MAFECPLRIGNGECTEPCKVFVGGEPVGSVCEVIAKQKACESQEKPEK